MKTLFILFVIFVTSFTIVAKDVIREGNTFVVANTTKSNEDKKTQFTYKDNKGNEYPIYISLRGSCYILKTSSKTNKIYKQYLGTKISKEICNELNIEYKGKDNK